MQCKVKAPAELIVWAAGIKAPDFLRGLDGLETDKVNRLVVRPALQTTREDDVFAIGGCAPPAWRTAAAIQMRIKLHEPKKLLRRTC